METWICYKCALQAMFYNHQTCIYCLLFIGKAGPSNSSLDIILSSLGSGIKWGEYQQFQFYEFTIGKHPKECVSVVTPDTKQGRAIPCVKESILFQLLFGVQGLLIWWWILHILKKFSHCSKELPIPVNMNSNVDQGTYSFVLRMWHM